ncbi:hypothetical protein [Neptuniibacter sp. QD37_11]|uniref:hypothetical protein n=1 Tax=Neptuniibacter sp. QD37_11 TaxID=3398209 RepID=UPI0039F5FA4D
MFTVKPCQLSRLPIKPNDPILIIPVLTTQVNSNAHKTSAINSIPTGLPLIGTLSEQGDLSIHKESIHESESLSIKDVIGLKDCDEIPSQHSNLLTHLSTAELIQSLLQDQRVLVKREGHLYKLQYKAIRISVLHFLMDNVPALNHECNLLDHDLLNNAYQTFLYGANHALEAEDYRVRLSHTALSAMSALNVTPVPYSAMQANEESVFAQFPENRAESLFECYAKHRLSEFFARPH